MRAFLAVEPSGEALGELNRALKVMQGVPGLSPVQDNQLHLTIRFFADIAEDKAAAMKDALRDVMGFEAKLYGAGAFPDWQRPRVIWAGAGPAERWEGLHRTLCERLEPLGFPAERFTPHITLARVREGFISGSTALGGMPLKAAFPVRELVLKRSVLSSGGPVHTLLWAAPLTQDI